MLLSVCCKAQIALFIVESEFICFLELFISDGIREVIRKIYACKEKKKLILPTIIWLSETIFSLWEINVLMYGKKKPKQQNTTLRKSSSLLMLSWNPELTMMAFNLKSQCRWEERGQGGFLVLCPLCCMERSHLVLVLFVGFLLFGVFLILPFLKMMLN